MGRGKRLSSALPQSVRNRLSSIGVKAGTVISMFDPFSVDQFYSSGRSLGRRAFSKDRGLHPDGVAREPGCHGVQGLPDGVSLHPYREARHSGAYLDRDLLHSDHPPSGRLCVVLPLSNNLMSGTPGRHRAKVTS
jgi:hypothetical protein